MTLRSGDSFWSNDVWLVVLFSSTFALEMLTPRHSPLIGDRFCEMTVYARHILSRDYLVLRVYPFWEDAFILGHNHLTDFDIENWPSVYDYCFRWIIEMMIFLGSIFLAHLVWFDYPLTFVGHLNILPLIPLPASILSEPYIFLLNPPISSSYMTLSPSLDQERMQTSLEFSGRVFTCLYTLGSTSSMMAWPIRLLMYLWWCFHIDSWYVVSCFAYISNFESWSAFVWSIILVLLC